MYSIGLLTDDIVTSDEHMMNVIGTNQIGVLISISNMLDIVFVNSVCHR